VSGLGSPYGQPRHHIPNVGGSVILEADYRPKRMGEPMSTVVCSPISHRKISRCLVRTFGLVFARREEGGVPEEVRFATKGEFWPRGCSGGYSRRRYQRSEWRTWSTARPRPCGLARRTGMLLRAGGDRDARRLPRGHQRRTRTLAKHLPEEAGVRASAGKVSKGERLYEWACVALPDPDGAETGCWLADRGLFRGGQGGGRPGRVRGQKVGRLVPPRQPLHIGPRYLAVVRSITEHEERATKGGISSQKISILS
jgi:hypothetical protein